MNNIKNRAKQFMAFSPLGGYDSLIKKANDIPESMPIIDEATAENIDNVIRSLCTGDTIIIKFYHDNHIYKKSCFFNGIADNKINIYTGDSSINNNTLNIVNLNRESFELSKIIDIYKPN